MHLPLSVGHAVYSLGFVRVTVMADNGSTAAVMCGIEVRPANAAVTASRDASAPGAP